VALQACVSEPAGSVPALRQIPNGLIPNVTQDLTALIRSLISRTSVSTLSRRHCARLCDLWVRCAKLLPSPKSCPASGYG
jgi:hypothetical protein